MATERLRVILELVSGQYKREAREAATATGRISAETKTASAQVNKFGGVLRSAAVVGGIVAVGRGLWSAIEAAEQSVSAFANTEQIIKQTGGAANVTAEDIVEMSRKLSALTGVQDEVVQEGANILLTFKKIRNEVGEGNDVFDRTAALMLDIGAVMGTDASSAALQLGKALNDPVSQMGALSRAGLTFDAEQKELIKTLAESGDLLSAQKIILSELETQLGGTAAASADASDKIGSALGEIGESVGKFLLPVLDTAAIELQRMVGLIDDLDRLSLVTGQGRESATLLAGALHQLGLEYELNARKGDGAAGSIDRFTDEARELIDMAGLSVTELSKLRGGLDFLVESMGLSSEQAEVLANLLDDKLNRALADLVNSGADEVLRSKINPALIETGDVAEKAAADIKGISDEFRSMIDPAFKALDALDKHVKAQADLATVLLDSSASSDKAEEAGRKVLETYGDLVAAADAYSEVSGQNLIDSLHDLGAQAGVPLEVIESIVASLNELDGFVATAKINVATTGGTFIPRQHGGPVAPNQLYRVGEQNKPELMMIPGDRGTVFSNADTKKIIAAFSGGESGGQTINVTPITTANPNDIAAAVSWSMRTAGV